MHPRNYKVRIHNLTLKKTVFLEANTTYNQLRVKYMRYMESLGYILARSGGSTAKNVKLHTYYSKKQFPTRKMYIDSWKQYDDRYLTYDTNHRPVTRNPHVVIVEIIRFNHKHAPK